MVHEVSVCIHWSLLAVNMNVDGFESGRGNVAVNVNKHELVMRITGSSYGDR